MSAARIRLDRQACVVAGVCVLLAPELFDQSEQDGQVILAAGAEVTDPELVDAALAAADGCPSGAIAVRVPSAVQNIEEE